MANTSPYRKLNRAHQKIAAQSTNDAEAQREAAYKAAVKAEWERTNGHVPSDPNEWTKAEKQYDAKSAASFAKKHGRQPQNEAEWNSARAEQVKQDAKEAAARSSENTAHGTSDHGHSPTASSPSLPPLPSKESFYAAPQNPNNPGYDMNGRAFQPEIGPNGKPLRDAQGRVSVNPYIYLPRGVTPEQYIAGHEGRPNTGVDTLRRHDGQPPAAAPSGTPVAQTGQGTSTNPPATGSSASASNERPPTASAAPPATLGSMVSSVIGSTIAYVTGGSSNAHPPATPAAPGQQANAAPPPAQQSSSPYSRPC